MNAADYLAGHTPLARGFRVKLYLGKDVTIGALSRMMNTRAPGKLTDA